MNDDTNLTNEEQDAAAFALSLSAQVIADCMAVNNTLATMNIQPTTAKGSMAFYAAHYANAEIDSYGVPGIVREVLTEAEAIFPRNADKNPEWRAAVVEHSLFTDQVIELAKPKFAKAKLRYKPQSVRNQLSTYGTDEIGKVDLTMDEDIGRGDGKPRKKYYLIKKEEKTQ